MISTLLIISGILSGMLLICGIIGTTLDDIATIRRDKRIRRHPHAKAYRQRPFVTVIVKASKNKKDLERCIASIKASRYRNKRIVIIQPGQTALPHGRPQPGIVLTVRSDATIANNAIISAVQQLSDEPSRASIELLPVATSPTTMLQLLQNYRLFFDLMAVKSRNAFGLTGNSQPVLQRSVAIQKTPKRQRVYTGVMTLTTLILPVTLLYVTYIAIALHQPQLLLVIIAGVSLLIVTLLWTASMLTLTEKLAYTALLPVSFGYFYVQACLAFIKTCLHLIHIRGAARNVYGYANS